MTQINSIPGTQVQVQTSYEAAPVAPRANTSGSLLIGEQSLEDLAASLGGSPEAYVAAFAMKHADTRNTQAREQRRQIEDNIAASQAKQIEKMHDQADAIRTGAWVSGALGVAGGVSTVMSGLKLNSGTSGAKLNSGTGESASKLWQGAGEMAGALSNGSRGLFDAAATNYQADATAAGNRADASSRQLQIVNDDLDAARELEGKALDFLGRANDTRAQTDQSVIIRG